MSMWTEEREEREAVREASRLSRKRHPINACTNPACDQGVEWMRTCDDYEDEGPGPYFGYCMNRDGTGEGLGCGRKADPADYPIGTFPDLFEMFAVDSYEHHGTEFNAEEDDDGQRRLDKENRERAVWFRARKSSFDKYVRASKFKAAQA